MKTPERILDFADRACEAAYNSARHSIKSVLSGDEALLDDDDGNRSNSLCTATITAGMS